VPPDSYWVVIQKGQFRREYQMVVGPGLHHELDPADSTLPSELDPINGKWIPKIALASGVFDDLQDILGKMGMGAVDGTGRFQQGSSSGIFDVYSNGGAIDGSAVNTLAWLVDDLQRMLQYHIIFIPCSGSTNTSVLSDVDVLRNIRDYVKAGGKLYVTDWSGEWADNVFPAQIDLGSVDTPADAYDPATDTWTIADFGDADGSPSYASNSAEAADENLNQWLATQAGPLATGGMGAFNASNFVVTGNWNHIEGLNSVQIGVDDDGNPVFDEPRVYVLGPDDNSNPNLVKPLTVTFEPTGCGRVLYSTYHTTDDTHVGLVPQERVLLYLMLEIGECKEGPIVD
jgi:hypothetical protein